MDSLLEFDTAAAAEALGNVFIHDNPGGWYWVEELSDGRFRLVVKEPPVV